MKVIGSAYRHPVTYRLLMKVLYRGMYQRHYEALCKEIGDLSLLELCCGDCQIVDYLKGNAYRGMDINRVFVDKAAKRGLNVAFEDVRFADIPEAECILIHNSLYQFYPRHEDLIKRALESATNKLIISEPVVNLSSSRNRVISFLAKRLTRVAGPKGDSADKRFNRDEMNTLFQRFNAEKIEFLGRNLMGVILVNKTGA